MHFNLCSMKKLFTLLAFLAIVGTSNLLAQTSMYVVSPYSDSIWSVDTTTWTASLPGTALTLPGYTITGSNGLAVQPCSGQFYTISKISGVTGRVLCTVDPVTGVLDSIGNTGDNIAGIAFRDDTTLIGITGDGGTVGETLFRIDINTGALTLIGGSPAGSDGETIAYCPDNNRIYRWSGRNTDPAMEWWGEDSTNPVTVTLSGFNFDETFSATYIGGGTFLLANLDQEFVLVDTAGFASPAIGATHNYYKGMAFPIASAWVAAGSPDTICSQGDSSIVAAWGADATGYQWYLDGGLIPGATADTLVVYTPGTYLCNITTSNPACGSGASGPSVEVFAHTTVSPVITPAMQGICLGDSAMFTANSSDSSEWWMDTVLVSTDTSLTVMMQGTYTYSLYTNGCKEDANVNLLVSTLSAIATGNDVLCFGDSTTGAVSAATTGELGTVSYTWSTGDTVASVNGLDIGTYTVVTTDSIGCTDTAMVSISEPAELTTSATTVDVLCNGDSTGSAVVTALGGTGTLTEDWGTANPSALMAGVYTYTVTDSNGCMVSDTVTINEPAALSLSASGTNETTPGNNGTIDLTVAGGTGGYTYDWDNDGTGDFDDSEDLSGLTAGTYMVTVMDSNGCTGTTSVTITSSVGLDEFGVNAEMQIYPNPSTGHFFIKLTNIDLDKLNVNIFDVSGKLLRSKNITDNVIEMDLTDLGTGTYTVSLTNGVKRSSQQIIITH